MVKQGKQYSATEKLAHSEELECKPLEGRDLNCLVHCHMINAWPNYRHSVIVVEQINQIWHSVQWVVKIIF